MAMDKHITRLISQNVPMWKTVVDGRVFEVLGGTKGEARATLKEHLGKDLPAGVKIEKMLEEWTRCVMTYP
jgi:hypothetical protein